MASRKTAPKPRQITKSEVVRDDVLETSQIVNLEDELNYIRSVIKNTKGTENYDDLISENLKQISERLTNSEGFFHTQSDPQTTWTIIHSLNRYPNVIIFDTEYNQIYAKVKMLNVNTARIVLSEPLSGFAFLK